MLWNRLPFGVRNLQLKFKKQNCLLLARNNKIWLFFKQSKRQTKNVHQQICAQNHDIQKHFYARLSCLYSCYGRMLNYTRKMHHQTLNPVSKLTEKRFNRCWLQIYWQTTVTRYILSDILVQERQLLFLYISNVSLPDVRRRISLASMHIARWHSSDWFDCVTSVVDKGDGLLSLKRTPCFFFFSDLRTFNVEDL